MHFLYKNSNVLKNFNKESFLRKTHLEFAKGGQADLKKLQINVLTITLGFIKLNFKSAK